MMSEMRLVCHQWKIQTGSAKTEYLRNVTAAASDGSCS